MTFAHYLVTVGWLRPDGTHDVAKADTFSHYCALNDFGKFAVGAEAKRRAAKRGDDVRVANVVIDRGRFYVEVEPRIEVRS